MINNNYVVIMAGGIGSRFWPYSRISEPKQFLDIFGTGKSLLQMTYERFLSIAPAENIFIVSSKDYEGLIKDQLPEVSDHNLLLEPVRRNTAPCVAYAAYKIAQKDPDATLVITPSDHAIFKETAFVNTLMIAVNAAKNYPYLITLGIKPNRPETGYGYIQFLESEDDIKKVKTFTEKPERALAEKFLESGDFVWNSGMFIWKAKTIIEAFQSFLPEISELFSEVSESFYTKEEAAKITEAYSLCRNISIDYGIMEKAPNVYVVLGDFGWSDLGSWNSLHEIMEKDDHQNVVKANTLLYDTSNCLIKGDKDKLIVIEGLENFLVADCSNVLLICHKENEQRIRDFVAEVKEKKGKQYL